MQDAAIPTFRRLAIDLLPSGGWQLRGFADEEDLPALLSAAELLCYPSLAEGFGLPVLEAFGCGTALVTSNTTSLPEVAGDAAVLVDPTDTSALARALEDVLSDDRSRAEIAARGLVRAKAFTWGRIADQMADLIANAIRR
jgi:glycosyltransferase involved in cell wall biosynthesis